MSRIVVAVAILTATLLLPTATLTAQGIVIECQGPEPKCVTKVPTEGPIQRASLELRITGVDTDAIPVKVTFKTTSGTVFPESTMADPSGIVRTSWFRPRATDTVAVAVHASTATKGNAVKMVILEPEPAPAPHIVKILLEQTTRGEPSWFAGSVLRDTVRLKLLQEASPIVPVSTEATCKAQRVVFLANQAAGVVSPDTVTPVWINSNGTMGCFANTFWTLGNPGQRRIRASVIAGTGYKAGDPVELTANVRPLPKFVSGLALAQRKPFATAKAGKDTVLKVERLLPGGEKLVYDSIRSGKPGVEEFNDELAGAAFAGISGPIVPGWRRISVTAGVDLAAPRERWFAGLSLLRLFWPNTESFNVDLHLVGHWARDTRLEDKDACAATGACKTVKDIDFQKFGLVATLDAGTLIGELVKKLAP